MSIQIQGSNSNEHSKEASYRHNQVLKDKLDSLSLTIHLELNKYHIAITILKQNQIFIGRNLLHESIVKLP